MSTAGPPGYLKKPHFVFIEEDGSVTLEWSIDYEGAPDHWRILFVCDPIEGIAVIETRRDCQNTWEGPSALIELARLLQSTT